MLQQLGPRYVDTGKAKFIYRNYPAIGQESDWAAQAAECAGDQNKFWAYGNYLFTHQVGENTGAFSISNLKQFASILNLNRQTFDACLDSGKYATLVQQEKAQGVQRGVTATPTFFINGKKVEGFIPADQMAAMIDAAQPK